MQTQFKKPGSIILILLLLFGLSGFGQSVVISETPACDSNGTFTFVAYDSGFVSMYLYEAVSPYNHYPSQFSDTATFTNLRAGWYVLNVYYSTFTSSTLYAMPAVVNVSTTITNTVCPADTGSIVITASGGTGTYIYTCNGFATGPLISNLSGGVYNIIVTDGNGCFVSVLDTVVTISTNLNVSTIVTNTTCPADSGSIVTTVTSGTAPYYYTWNNGDSTSSISNLAGGVYSVTVIDSNGCSANLTDTVITTSSSMLVAITDSGLECHFILTALATGGRGTISYNWSDGATTAGMTGPADGITGLFSNSNYTVTATDSTGCADTASQVIPGFHISVTTTPTACDTTLYTGTATAIITGTGTPPYSFAWYEENSISLQQVLASTNQTITGLGITGSNSYGIILIVSDASGCDASNADNIGAVIQLDTLCYDHIIGYVFTDTNGTCTYNMGDPGYPAGNVIATAANGQTYYGNPDSTGYYDMEVPPGAYVVTVSLWSNSSCFTNTCVTAYNDTFNTTGLVSSGNNFAQSGTAFDLGIHMGHSPSLPGQNRNYWVYYYNWGDVAVANGTLTFIHDSNVVLVNVLPAYTSYNPATYTITWDIVNNLAPMVYLDMQHRVSMTFFIPDSLPLGSELTDYAHIAPTVGDCDTTNNSQFLTDFVTGAHDPNQKQVSPVGNLSATDTVLTYTIRFQNTGNEAASLVVITDTLSPNVNPATVQPGASSSPYTWKLSGNGILTFTFEPINLIDSAQSADSSQGFVMYTVQTKKNLPIGSQINNTAYIYFNVNPAIVTNTTTNLRTDSSTGIAQINSSNMTARVLPNPASDKARIEFEGATGIITIKVSDALGNIVANSNSAESYYTLNVEKLAAGIYFYAAEDANGNRVSGKISIVH